MANIVLIEDDPRVERQVRNFLAEQEEGHRLRAFPSGASFEERYFSPSAGVAKSEDASAEDVPSEAGSDQEADELRLMSQIDLIIFKMSCVEKDTLKWIERTQVQLRAGKFWREGQRTRMILLKYEDDNIMKSSLVHPLLDDLIYLPLDRLIFLQKVDIILNLPKKAAPRFLFSQDADMQIEISKRSRIDRLSDLGFAVKNPVPLVPGLLGHFYFKLPDAKTWSETYAKVHGCEKHPEEPGQYLVYFTFFGIKKEVLSQIRRYLMSNPNNRSFINANADDFAFNPDDIFLTDQEKSRKTVALIDINPETLKTVSEMIKKEVPQARVIATSSYSRFLLRHLQAGGEKSVADKVKAATSLEFFADPVTFTVEANSQNLVRVLTVPADGSEKTKFLGIEAEDLFATPQAWQKMFTGPETAAVLKEGFDIVRLGHAYSTDVDLKNAQGEGRKVHLEMKLDGGETEVRISLSPLREELGATEPPPARLESLDLLVIDDALVPEDVSAWLEGLHGVARKAGMLKESEALKVLVMVDPQREERLERLRSAPIYAVSLKPVERRGFLFSVASATGAVFTLYRPSNVYWARTLIPVNIAKRVKLEKFSEFGATFRHPRPISVGTPLYLHSGIYDNAPDGNLLSRVYFNEEHPVETDEALCSVLYYGINDAFLKYIRAFIRDVYAAKKAEGG